MKWKVDDSWTVTKQNNKYQNDDDSIITNRAFTFIDLFFFNVVTRNKTGTIESINNRLVLMNLCTFKNDKMAVRSSISAIARL